jgi:hypothetical protein
MSPLTGLSGQVNLLPKTSRWICYKKQKVLNIIHTAILWTLWRMRNDLCFNSGLVWKSKGGLHPCAMENPVSHGCKRPSGQRDWGIEADCARTSSLQLVLFQKQGISSSFSQNCSVCWVPPVLVQDVGPATFRVVLFFLYLLEIADVAILPRTWMMSVWPMVSLMEPWWSYVFVKKKYWTPSY